MPSDLGKLWNRGFANCDIFRRAKLAEPGFGGQGRQGRARCQIARGFGRNDGGRPPWNIGGTLHTVTYSTGTCVITFFGVHLGQNPMVRLQKLYVTGSQPIRHNINEFGEPSGQLGHWNSRGLCGEMAI